MFLIRDIWGFFVCVCNRYRFVVNIIQAKRISDSCLWVIRTGQLEFIRIYLRGGDVGWQFLVRNVSFKFFFSYQNNVGSSGWTLLCQTTWISLQIWHFWQVIHFVCVFVRNMNGVVKNVNNFKANVGKFVELLRTSCGILNWIEMSIGSHFRLTKATSRTYSEQKWTGAGFLKQFFFWNYGWLLNRFL